MPAALTSAAPAVAITRGAPSWPPSVDRLVKDAVTAAASRLAANGQELPENAEISVLLTDDESIRVLNRRFRNRDAATNVLSFPAASGAGGDAGLLGDIALGRETITREAIAQGLTLEAHLTHLVIHGFLHILGYDHDDEAHAADMERLEIAILADLGIADPYGDVAPATDIKVRTATGG